MKQPRNPTPGPNGGARPGAGRKRLNPDDQTVTLVVRIPLAMREQLRAAGITNADIRAALGRLITRRQA